LAKNLIRLLYYGLPAAIVTAGFLRRLIAFPDYAVLSPGDEVSVAGIGLGRVEWIDHDQVTIRRTDGRLVTAPLTEVTER
jgi:hypothetical protein